MLTRSMTMLVPNPQRRQLQLAAVCRQNQRRLVRVDLSIHSNRRTTASRHMLGARKEKEARGKEARERPDGSTVLGHPGRTPGHQSHPGTDRRGDRIPESRIPPAITTTIPLPPTTGSTNPGSRMPQRRKLLLERTNRTPITTTTTMNPGSSPTTKRNIRTSPQRSRPHKNFGRHHRPATILCRCRNRYGSPITCRSTTMKSRPSKNSDTWVRSD